MFLAVNLTNRSCTARLAGMVDEPSLAALDSRVNNVVFVESEQVAAALSNSFELIFFFPHVSYPVPDYFSNVLNNNSAGWNAKYNLLFSSEKAQAVDIRRSYL